jgi:dolichyl-phosphate beta-glucosyltransferase
VYIALNLLAPTPRPSRHSEKQYITILPDGARSEPKALPCWLDKWAAEKEAAKNEAAKQPGTKVVVPPQMPIEEPELFMSVVVPAYNEEERLEGMLEEAVEFLENEYGAAHEGGKQKGWEILIVSDGSKDGTVDKALEFAKEHQLSQHPVAKPGPWSKTGGTKAAQSTHIPHGSIRVITLEENRGKGGAVTHGMRHVRGQYIVFADADGASRFGDLGKMVEGCKKIEDKHGRGVAIGSRAHLVGSEAVVKVCLILTASSTNANTNAHTAIQATQLPYALFSYTPPHHDTTGDRSRTRYSVWLQTLLAAYAALHHPIHAL